MCVNNYGFNKLTVGMKLPKYNLSYNTRDLIDSLAKRTCGRKISDFSFTTRLMFDLIIIKESWFKFSFLFSFCM